MWMKYLILIFFHLFMNNVIGYEHQRVSRDISKDEMPSPWKTEINKLFTDKLEIELNKLKEKIEQRFEQNSIKKFEEKLEESLVKKLELKLEENVEKILARKIEENLGKKFKKELGENVEQNLESKLEGKLEARLKSKLEVEIEANLGKKLEENLGKKLEVNLENKLEVNLGKKLEIKLEENLRSKLEAKLEDNLAKKLENKFEDKFEKKQINSETEEWVMTSLENANSLSSRAVVGGYEPDGSPLWITKRTIENSLIPGKLNINAPAAYFTYKTKEHFYIKKSDTTWVLCAPPEKVRWVECRKGVVPRNAVVGGHTDDGEKLYIGRAKEQGSLIPGQVYPSKKVLYITYAAQEITRDTYEVLCLV